MKVLFFHASSLRIEAQTPGRCHRGARRNAEKVKARLGDALAGQDPAQTETSSQNALLAFVCVEAGDNDVRLEAVRDDIISAKALVGALEIVVGAFGHLSDNPAPPMLARQIMDDLVSMVRLDCPAAKTYPFGWDKSLELCVPCHHYNVSFKSYPSPVDAAASAQSGP